MDMANFFLGLHVHLVLGHRRYLYHFHLLCLYHPAVLGLYCFDWWQEFRLSGPSIQG